MFSRLSRYRAVPDTVVADARGRVLAAKDARPLPEVTGSFTHVVNTGDRLDQLAATFYGQPSRYWHICDANPRFLSPLALLGQEPLTTTRFPVTVPAGSAPPWAAVLAALAALVGVDDVVVTEDVTLVPQQQTVGGQSVTVMVQRFSRSVTVTYNRVNVDTAEVADVLAAAGFTVGPAAEGGQVGQVGQQIVIPAAVTG